MDKEELVSIGIPAFNRASKIGRTIESILAQTYRNFELIISDDASTDTTRKVCEEYAKKDKRIRCYRQQKNLGLNGNFSFLLNQARGEYFIWVGDDDYCYPNFISSLKNALDAHPDYGIAMSSVRRMYEDGEIADEIVYDGRDDVTKFSSERIFSAAIFQDPPVHLFTLGLWRKHIADRIFGYTLPNSAGNDITFVCELSFMTRLCSVTEILFEKTRYRIKKSERPAYRDHKKLYSENRAEIHFVSALIKRLLMSPNISIFQKIVLLPPRLFLLLWSRKGKLLHEAVGLILHSYK